MVELLPNWIDGQCYNAQLDRLMLGNVVCDEGVADIGGGSLLVTTGGSGLNVSVAQGGAWVEGVDDDRGFYSVYNDAPVTVTVAAANPTNPRIDQVIARVYDSTYGEGADEWVLEVLAGTATAGATLVNLNGAATLPDNSITLAYVLVPATFVGPFVNATHILDSRRPYGDCTAGEYAPELIGVDGTVEANYSRAGDHVIVDFKITVTDVSTAPVSFAPPFDPALPEDAKGVGTAFWSPGEASGLLVQLFSDGLFYFYVIPASTSGNAEYIGDTGQETAASQFIEGTLTYRLAS